MATFTGASANDKLPNIWEAAKRHNDATRFQFVNDGFGADVKFTSKGQAVRRRVPRRYYPVGLGA